MKTRIETIYKYIDKNDYVIDIGCDSAKLSIMLAKNKVDSIASDLRKNIIDTCIKNTPKELKKYIDYRVGDGLEVLTSEDKVNTVVLSGMGTSLILNIIKNKKFNKIITISNNNHYDLRSKMIEKGYKILMEEIIYENKKYYNLIIFVPGKDKYTAKDLYVGVNHQNIELLNKYKLYKINKLKKIIKSVPEGRQKELNEEINMLS